MGTGKDRKLLLYRFTQLIRALHPTTRTANPFQEEQNKLLHHLDIEDQLLFTELLHSLTLLNRYSRLNDHNELISSQPDFINALQLVLPEEDRLTPELLDAHARLQSTFKTRYFTYVEACSCLRISRRSLQRWLRPLLLHGLLTKHRPDNHGKMQLQITERATETAPGPTIFEQMQGSWKEFTGYVEF